MWWTGYLFEDEVLRRYASFSNETTKINDEEKENFDKIKEYLGTYYIEENGIFIIYTLQKLKIDMGKYKTAEIGKMLKKIANGSATLSEGVKAAEEQIEEYLINSKEYSQYLILM